MLDLNFQNGQAPALNARNMNAIVESINTLGYAVGGPNVASTVSEMTDTEKVYVYTGSETGYTAGNWYYYNGSAWVSGGVYQAAAVETDTTLTVPGEPADAKATGDAVADLKNDLDAVAHGIDRDFIGTPGTQGSWTYVITDGFYVGQKYIFTNNSTVYLVFTFRDGEGNAINIVGVYPGETKALVLTGLPTRLNIFSGGPEINCHIKSEYGLMDRVLTNEGRIQDMSYITEAVSNDENNLYIGELINGHLTAIGVVDDSFTDYRLSSKDIVALPSGSARIIRVKIAEGYLVAIRSGVRSDNLSNNLYWYKDGDTIIIPPGDNYYAISCCVDVSPTAYNAVKITTDDISKMHLGLYIHKYGDDSDESSEKILNAARLTFNTSAPNTLHSMPVIAHTSDCHGDYSRVKNFLEFCDRIHADLAAITGDLVSYRPYQGLGWFKELVNNADTISAVCVGNHDAYDSTITDEDVYNLVFDGITEKIGSTTEKTWYYKDVTNKSLRIISVNLYEYGGTTRNYTHFSNEQLGWLCDTLAVTPSGYGVILLYHSPQVNLNNALSSQYDKFFQVTRKYANIYSGVTGSPINDIIDAFIGRTTISKTYTQTGTPSSVSVTADFSAVDSTVEFIAHLTGHFHQDTVCYVPNTDHTQLMLNVICTNAIYGGTAYPYLCDLADLPRNSEDATQNSFNVYVIDRTAGTVKIIRVGSNTTYDMKKRDYMVIPYR